MARESTVQAQDLLGDSPRWQQRAACRNTGPAIFFPAGNPKLARIEEDRAKALCSSCPVRPCCLAHAIEHGEADGIWGGLSAEERRAVTAVRSLGSDQG